MKKKNKVLCFDIDNVLCSTKDNNYKKSKPIKRVINLVNDLYNEGYFIKIFTARYMGRNNDNVKNAKSQGYNLTSKQLNDWGLKYDKLIFGKPSYDIFIDDKSLGFKRNWTINFKKHLKKL